MVTQRIEKSTYLLDKVLYVDIPARILAKTFKIPYPRTTFVQASMGDPTSLELCRNLPIALFEEEEIPKPVQTATATGE